MKIYSYMTFKDIVTYIEIYMDLCTHKCYYIHVHINVCGYIHENHDNMIIIHVFCLHFFHLSCFTFKDLKSLLGETGVTTVDVMGSLL